MVTLIPILQSLLCYSAIGASRFQGGCHLSRGDYARVINHCVNFAGSAKTSLYLFDAFQPLQGCLAHIVSANVKDNFSQGGLVCLNHPWPNRSDQQESHQYCSKDSHYKLSIWNHSNSFRYLP